MIQKIIHKYNLNPDYEIKQNLQYWLSKTPEQRLDAVELFRRQIYENTQRLQKTARVVQRTKS